MPQPSPEPTEIALPTSPSSLEEPPTPSLSPPALPIIAHEPLRNQYSPTSGDVVPKPPASLEKDITPTRMNFRHSERFQGIM